MWFKKQKISTEEEVLIASQNLKNGSAEAFKILYNAYGQKVYRFCLRLLGDVELANDAFQEIFIKVYEKRNTFQSDNFVGWLFKIARNTCINYLRNKKDTLEIEDIYYYNDSYETEDYGLKREIKKAISQLPDSLREALILREYQDCTYQEIANILDIDVSLAKVRVYRARIILKKLLQHLRKEINES